MIKTMPSVSAQRDVETDIAVVGAGPAGLAAALSLAQSGYRVLCAGLATPPADTRTTALLRPSIDLLKDLGVWSQCVEHAAPLNTLCLIDDTRRLFRAPDAVFDASELGSTPFGYNIPNEALVKVLRRDLAERKGVDFQPTAGVVDITPGTTNVRVDLSEGGSIQARLVVGADGRGSLCRRKAGIKARSWDYPQMAIACSFGHTRAHRNKCIELHRRSGPLTAVPLPGQRSSLVWVETPKQAERLAGLDATAFAKELERSLHFALGRVTDVGPRGAFPLSGMYAHDYAANRIALIGEAAHVVPPIGAQGLNLGYRDVAGLTQMVKQAGEDPGSAQVVREYNSLRRGDVMTRTLASDLLNRTLYSSFAPFQIARGAGLHLVNTIGPLRRILMRQGLTPSQNYRL